MSPYICTDFTLVQIKGIIHPIMTILSSKKVRKTVMVDSSENNACLPLSIAKVCTVDTNETDIWALA